MGRFKDTYIQKTSSVYLDEGIADWVFTYQLLKRLALPFIKWPAYTNGLIDETGKLIRKPTDSDRSEYWGYFDRMVWNIKKIITKFTGHSQLTAALVSAYLLKEGLNSTKSDEVVSKLLGEKVLLESCGITQQEINANYNILKRELL